MPSDIIRVLVYDSSNLQCELLSTGLESLHKGLGVECVHDFESMIALLATEAKWVVIVSDNSLNYITSSFANHLHTRFPAVPLVFLLKEGRRDQVIEAFRLGARGKANYGCVTPISG
jgi:DNA-binding NarL/FixJ family response regulator